MSLLKQNLVRHEAFVGQVDIAETADAFVFKLDTPGMSKDDLKVKVANGKLQLSGERKIEHSEGDATHHRIERSYGKFCRTFQLPEGVDDKHVHAACDHGVLTVIVPKSESDTDFGVVEISSGEAEGDGSLNEEFEGVPIKLFPTPAMGKFVIIDSDTTLVDAVDILASNNILAAPMRMVSAPDDASWTEKYGGFVDMVGIVYHMLEVLEPEGTEPTSLKEAVENCEKLNSMKVEEMLGSPRFCPFIPVELDRGNLLDCMLLCGIRNIHRVPVVKSPGGDLENIITQSALVQTLSENLQRFESVGKKTLKQVGLGLPSRVWRVTEEQPLEEAFRIMHDKEISAVPVVGEDGTIKGNVSARDARLIISSPKIYKLLKLPVRQFLDVVTQVENSAVTCTPETTLEEVIKRLVTSRIHRIYVVNSQNRPIRVVSLSNVLRKFVKEPAGYFGNYFN